jgi:prevent-host-death family protein
MEQVNIHAAKTNLSRLVDKASRGESFVIAKAGKPMAAVVSYNSLQPRKKRVGFLKGFITAPDTIDAIGGDEIAALFEGAE